LLSKTLNGEFLCSSA